MDKDTILQISYEDLYALLVSVQDDALAADGCSYDCTVIMYNCVFRCSFKYHKIKKCSDN